MQSFLIRQRTFVALAIFAFGGGALANHPRVSADLGTPVHANVFDRQIDIGPRTKWTSVRREETIKFVVTKPDGSEDSFIWQFDTRGRPPVELSTIAPAGVLDGRNITVYVKPGLYDRGR